MRLSICILLLILVSLQLPVFGKDSAKTLMDRGNFLFFNGDADEAIAAFEEAAALEPDLTEAHLSLVNLYVRQKRTADAIEAARTLIRLKPGNGDWHLILANLLKKENRLAEAVDEFKLAVSNSHQKDQARNGLGYTLLQQGKFDEAVQTFESVGGNGETADAAAVGLALARFRLGHKEEALEKLESMLQSDCTMKGTVYETLGHLLSGLGRSREAEEFFARADEQGSGSFRLYLALGTAAMKKGDIDEAEKSILKACRLSPDSPEPFNALGALYLKTGKAGKAAEAIEKAMSRTAEVQAKTRLESVIDRLYDGRVYARQPAFDFPYTDLLLLPWSEWEAYRRKVEAALNLN